jgi:hypothetical protein
MSDMPRQYAFPFQCLPAPARGWWHVAREKEVLAIVDRWIARLLQRADGKSFAEIMLAAEGFGDQAVVSKALQILSAGGILSGRREKRGADDPGEHSGDLVSVIMVTHNSQPWLAKSLSSLVRQTYAPLEIIIVDNASVDGTPEWLAKTYPQVQLDRFEEPVPLARALNRGVHLARGEYFLLMNPDVFLERDSIAHLVAVARLHADCAAVAAKLRLSWSPGFINGIGNRVGPVLWGMDNGLGHVDCGQFDHWVEVPSACFALALIPKGAWREVGALDEDFYLYYEDSEWCYRARLMGLKVYAASRGVALHAMGRPPAAPDPPVMTLSKRRNVTYGRLRFAAKLLSSGKASKFILSYALADAALLMGDLLRGRWAMALALLSGWRLFLRHLPRLRETRRAVQMQRRISDKELFTVDRMMPPPYTYGGLPCLTYDIVVDYGHCAQGMAEGGSQEAEPSSGWAFRRRAGFRLWIETLRRSGVSILLMRAKRLLLHRLAQP